MTKAGKIQVEWSGATPYTLTGTAVASDEVVIDFAKKVTIYPYYSAGTGATTGQLELTVEMNPLNSTEDPTNLYWSQYGIYTDSSGTWSTEAAKYLIGQGTVGSYKAGIPLNIDPANAARIRITAKENNAGSSAGKARVYVVKNTIL